MANEKTVNYKNKTTGKPMPPCSEEEWKKIQENEQLAGKYQRVTAPETPAELKSKPGPSGQGSAGNTNP